MTSEKLNIREVRENFPIINGDPDLSYLDNAATTHMPLPVQEALSRYVNQNHGSPHRGAHKLSIKATHAYDGAREKVRAFIGAEKALECVFTRNSTESLNLIAYGYLMHKIQPGDKIITAITAHHSAILPLQMVAKSRGATLEYLYCDKTGRIPNAELNKIDETTKYVLVPFISNGIGVIHDVKAIGERAHKVGAVFAIDGAQAVGHVPLDVQALDADLFIFSGHKVLGPQGIGVLYGKQEILEAFEPFLRGGDMIEYVEEQSSTYAPLPERLEAGTQNVSGAVGLHAALDYIDALGVDKIQALEKKLTAYAYSKLSDMKGISLYGAERIQDRGSLITFNIDGVHPHDVASILDHHGVAIRAGHHCCQPLMKHLDLQSTCRVSFAVYNTFEEVDRFVDALYKVQEVFGYA